MTDIEVLLDGSSVVDVFAVNTARRKRVEVSERKMTESDRNLFRKAKELELQSWLDHRVFDLVKKKYVDQERIMRARWVLTWKSSGKAKARLCVLGFQDPDLTEVSPDSPTLSTASEALIMQWVASHKYRLISGDIKTAFLSGDEDVRNIFIAPPGAGDFSPVFSGNLEATTPPTLNTSRPTANGIWCSPDGFFHPRCERSHWLQNVIERKTKRDDVREKTKKRGQKRTNDEERKDKEERQKEKHDEKRKREKARKRERESGRERERV